MAYLIAKCPKCAEENFPEANYCIGCGESLLDAPLTKIFPRANREEIIERHRSVRKCPVCDWDNPGAFKECGRCQHTLVEWDNNPEVEIEPPQGDVAEPDVQLEPIALRVLRRLAAAPRWKRIYWTIAMIAIALVIMLDWTPTEHVYSQILGVIFFGQIMLGIFYFPYSLIEKRKAKNNKTAYKSHWKRVYWSVAGGSALLVFLDSASRNENAIGAFISILIAAGIFYLPIWLIVRLFRGRTKMKSEKLEFRASLLVESAKGVSVTPDENTVYSPKLAARTNSSWRTFVRIAVFLFLLVVAPKVVELISDSFTIATADSSMKQLAEDAGMNRKGELIFLHSNPTYASAEDMSSKCKAVSNGSDYVEQGCYVFNENTIYIRSMPSELHGVEVVTAAHEMLHAAYAKFNSAKIGQVNSEMENYYKGLADPELASRMTYYSKAEPGAADNELNSIIGTEQTSIPESLEAYYSEYFSDRSLVTSSNATALSAFDNYLSQMTTLENEYNTWMNAANKAYSYGQTAYYNSSTWAAVGNAYENDRNYNIYLQDFNLYKQDYSKAEDYAKQYDDLVQKYNNLRTQYNGQPVNNINVPQQAVR